MKHTKDLFLLPLLIAGLGLMMLAGRVKAQTFTTLHSFSDGSPHGGLILSGNTLYGTARPDMGFGVDPPPPPGRGTVFAINTDGTYFVTLHSFAGSSDGANPIGGLIL